MLALTDTQIEQSHTYLDELYLWNQRINLTSVGQEAAWKRHIDESLVAISAFPDEVARVADIGSGGGIPGVVVAIARPDVQVSLIESDQRKSGFLMHVSGLLRLGNITVLPQRAEAVAASPEHFASYDVAVSRAAGPIAKVVEWSLPLIRPNGHIIILTHETQAADIANVNVQRLDGLVVVRR